MEQRRRDAAAALARHSLFSFQIHDADVAARVHELRELLLATCDERDQGSLLAEHVHEIEDQLRAQGDARQTFLLEPLRRFAQETELLLDVGSGDSDEVDEEEEESESAPSSQEDAATGFQQQISAMFVPEKTPVVTATSKGTGKQQEEEEILCGVCCALDSLETDPIVICELCGVAVHQTCYRLAVLPDGDWYCHPCARYLEAQDVEKNVIPTHELECEACCTRAGALTPAADGGWVHVACSMFLPELFVQEKHPARFQNQHDDLQVVGCLKHQAKFLSMDGLSGGDSEEDPAAVEGHHVESLVEGATPKEKVTKKSQKRSRKNSWSEDDDDESDDADEDENQLDSDSEADGSQDSISDDDGDLANKLQGMQGQTGAVKKSPPRLLAGSRQRKNSRDQIKKPKRSRQSTLSFAATKFAGQPTASPVASTLTSIPTPPVVSSARTRQDLSASRSHSTDPRLVLQTSVFAPVFYPPAYKADDSSEKGFEYVMVLISSRPLGLGIRSSLNANTPGIFLQAQTTVNSAVLAALDRGVIQDGDELFAFNNQVLRNADINSFKRAIMPTLPLPVRCWFRTKCKHPVAASIPFADASVSVETPVRADRTTLASDSAQTRQQQMVLPFSPAIPSPAAQENVSIPRGDDGEIMSLGSDWPWVFLRSDGKLAMNLFWRSLDSAFFLQKINKRTFAQLQGKVEDMCGVRLSSSHPEYRDVRELLVMPRRERVPTYLVEFRKTRKQKQTFLTSDIFVGVTSETKSVEVAVDEQTALVVGTTVTVAKRTWPGINKLGGAGRIKKVNEEIVPDGKKRFTYNIAYVLGGSEKNVERKYISVVDLNAEQSDKSEGSSSTAAGSRTKAEPEPEVGEGEGTSSLSVRLAFHVERTPQEEKLLALPEPMVERPPRSRRFQLQISTENGTVFCERKMDPKRADPQKTDAPAPAKELLLHRHFDVKLGEVDALLSECFRAELATIEDRVGDEVDEDESESETEGEDEIKTELATLQEQFRVAMFSNEQIFGALKDRVEREYASKGYRQRTLQEIQWRNHERMYQELQTARRQFDDSDDEEDEDMDEPGRVPSTVGGKRRKIESEEEEDSANEDESCGGLFVNKIKQEGNEVCALCELSGGDFAATDSGGVVHPQCAMFTPETFFKGGVAHGIDQVAPERRRLACAICGGRKGLSKIQCASRKCTLAYHVACAFVNGLLTRDPYYQAWCPRHLKTSGMAHFVELPGHLQKQEGVAASVETQAQPTSGSRRGRKPNKQRGSSLKKSRRETTPSDASTAGPGGISSSKTNRKRKRKTSSAGAGAVKNARGARGSPSSVIVIDDEEPRCARRLAIDDMSDDNTDSDQETKAVAAWQEGRKPSCLFAVNDVVEVLAREWRGSNKPGGVARVKAVGVGGKEVFYDVSYVVGAGKEKHVAARFVRRYQPPSAA
ncbi:hypothetical protein BBJ28_00001354 [Nothophytophthora sp. Chile5]|nr:hypothetical protein BBJ28_00001354 [Nothophytophthora sp. Chile5]